MLRVRYSDTGQESFISEYSLIEYTPINRERKVFVVCLSSINKDHPEYDSMVFQCISRFTASYIEEPTIRSHRAFLFRESIGVGGDDAIGIFIIGRPEVEGFDEARLTGYTLPLIDTGKHFHFDTLADATRASNYVDQNTLEIRRETRLEEGLIFDEDHCDSNFERTHS